MKHFQPFTLNLGGRLWEIGRPQVMAIVNVTDDSFHAESRVVDPEAIARRAIKLVADGADMLDVGACSTRPGAEVVAEETEKERVVMAVKAIRSVLPAIPVSVDTFRASVAASAIAVGADIVNDVSGGDLDDRMFEAVASLRVPYILTHSRGTPATMQSLTDYDDVVADVITDLSRKIEQLRLMGVCDIIVDPGLGFAKTTAQCYRLLDATGVIADMLDCPVLIGASRKSMLTGPLAVTAAEALNATTVVNTIALERGAAFLRVHDPKEARETVTIVSQLPSRGSTVFNPTF
ncbi:MAG: dihydropteroate synthase [Muribaculaceae bacterium]|nr:dihydropteroate synthase [Muribaculaceae bacterium]